MGSRSDGATQIKIYDTGTQVNYKSDGHVGAIKIIIEHDKNFDYKLSNEAFLPYANTNNNRTTFIIVRTFLIW